MAAKKHFLQDRTALLLVSGLAFVTLAAIILTLLKVGGNSGNYIISYRASLGIDRYTTGTLRDILGFILAAIVIFTASVSLGYRAYAIRRELSLTILILTFPLLVFLIVVSNALLVLR